MVSRDECVKGINKFIKTRSTQDIITLFSYLCEIKQVPNTDELIKVLNNNMALLLEIIPLTLEELYIQMEINRVSQNNTIITVF